MTTGTTSTVFEMAVNDTAQKEQIIIIGTGQTVSPDNTGLVCGANGEWGFPDSFGNVRSGP